MLVSGWNLLSRVNSKNVKLLLTLYFTVPQFSDVHCVQKKHPLTFSFISPRMIRGIKQKFQSSTWYSAPSRHSHLKGAQVHGAHQAASHVPALYLPSCSRYSSTDPERMEGWVSPGPGCNEQLAHGCYATARIQWTRTRDLAAAGRAR